MDKFDRQFNDVDIQTGRPFSGGHPDGVWMISILYALSIVVCAGGFWFSFLQDPIALPLSLLCFVIVVVHGSVIVFLFRRSSIAAYINPIVTVIAGVFAVYALINALPHKNVTFGIFAGHAFISYYLMGLVRDQIIKMSNSSLSNKMFSRLGNSKTSHTK